MFQYGGKGFMPTSRKNLKSKSSIKVTVNGKVVVAKTFGGSKDEIDEAKRTLEESFERVRVKINKAEDEVTTKVLTKQGFKPLVKDDYHNGFQPLVKDDYQDVLYNRDLFWQRHEHEHVWVKVHEDDKYEKPLIKILSSLKLYNIPTPTKTVCEMCRLIPEEVYKDKEKELTDEG